MEMRYHVGGRLAAVALAYSLAGAQAKAGWDLVWSDEFEEAALDTGKWTLANAPWNSNQELEYYSNRTQNAFLRGGSLIIRALKEDVGGRNYTSARLSTRYKGDWLYGRVEVRARLNQGKGMWPAIWMMPTDEAYGGWPSSGEMDIMELLGHEPAKVYATLHWSDAGHKQQGSSTTLPAGTFADGFHVFGFEWEAGKQTWLLDGVPYFETAKAQPFDKRFYLILNVAVGGSWPGNPDATTPFPNDMAVDWVRVYRKAAGAGLGDAPAWRGMRLSAASFEGATAFGNGDAPAELALADLRGRVRWAGHAAPAETVVLGKGLPLGVYLLRVAAGGETRTLRLAKAR